nr:MAG TPA: hypothetical protein [Caudoviricetes sp.]
MNSFPVPAPIFLQSRLCASGFSDGFYSRTKGVMFIRSPTIRASGLTRRTL